VRLVDEATEANLVGKRYRCANCGTEVMCVKGGSGRFHCHDAPMELLTAKPLPSSD
jgi:Desulfoferrodoxin, N-terminal domain